MSRRRVDRAIFVTATDVDHVRPVFKVLYLWRVLIAQLIYKAVLGALPAAFTAATDTTVVQLSLTVSISLSVITFRVYRLQSG